MKFKKLRFNKDEIEFLKNKYNISNRDIISIERAALNLIIKENKWIEFAESLIIQSESGGC